MCQIGNYLYSFIILSLLIYSQSLSKFKWHFSHNFLKILNSRGTKKDPEKSQNNPERKKDIAGCTTPPDFKIYYQTTVMKTVLDQHKDRHTDQWNRIESPEMSLYLYCN